MIIRPILCLFLCAISFSIFAQTNPRVDFATPVLIQGTGATGDIIRISTDNDFSEEHSVAVDKNGSFKFSFPTALKVNDIVIVWSESSSKEISQRISVIIEDPESVVAAFSGPNFSPKSFTNLTAAGRTIRYKATIMNTNFSIPLARFNFSKEDNEKAGDLLLFNSIGAGFGFSAGELEETRNLQGDLINQEFVNTFGVHLGFLFSAGTGEDVKNVFAPTFNISILDFQLGIGYELGSLSPNQRPGFLTLSYAIPLYKMKKGGFWIWKSATPITSPLESRQGE